MQYTLNSGIRNRGPSYSWPIVIGESEEAFRLGKGQTGGTAHRRSATEASFQRWLGEYEAVSQTKSTCRLLAALGSGRTAVEIELILRLHDAESCGKGVLA